MSEYNIFPMKIFPYKIGMELKKGWWIRSPAGSIMVILDIEKDRVKLGYVGSFGDKENCDIYSEAFKDKDIKEAVESSTKVSLFFDRSEDPRKDQFMSWSVVRPISKKESEEIVEGIYFPIHNF